MWGVCGMAKKIQTGVTLKPEVIAYLDQIAREQERTRSQVINRIVKDYARRQQAPVSSNNNEEPQNSR